MMMNKSVYKQASMMYLDMLQSLKINHLLHINFCASCTDFCVNFTMDWTNQFSTFTLGIIPYFGELNRVAQSSMDIFLLPKLHSI